jgi:prevent-host-death family protein
MKSVRIADLKARLSEFLRQVRAGDTVVVLDRDTPVAQIVPYAADFEPLHVRPPRGRYGAPHEVPLPRPLKIKTDVVALLLAERQVDR